MDEASIIFRLYIPFDVLVKACVSRAVMSAKLSLYVCRYGFFPLSLFSLSLSTVGFPPRSSFVIRNPLSHWRRRGDLTAAAAAAAAAEVSGDRGARHRRKREKSRSLER